MYNEYLDRLSLPDLKICYEYARKMSKKGTPNSEYGLSPTKEQWLSFSNGCKDELAKRISFIVYDFLKPTLNDSNPLRSQQTKTTKHLLFN